MSSLSTINFLENSINENLCSEFSLNLFKERTIKLLLDPTYKYNLNSLISRKWYYITTTHFEEYDDGNSNIMYIDFEVNINIEKKIYTNKGYLSLYSPFFERTFYSSFAGIKIEEFKFKDVDILEFVELLIVIYPTDIKINERKC
uniref:BTB domain-containing protein n=1 Tax=Parastrongyloides trichosuri TaxID=131310 RepID=A0A0N4Z3I8_PARTI